MKQITLQKTLWALAVLAALGALGIQYWIVPSSQSNAPAIKAQFELTDHRRKLRTNKDFEGRWLLVFYGFANCPDICPTTLSEVAAVMDGLGEASDQVQPLFITIDPERDTPEELAEFIPNFHPEILGLSGTPDQIDRAAQILNIYHQRMEDSQAVDGYAMSHSSQLFLFDTEGQYVSSWNYGTPADEIISDLRGKLAS